MAATDARPFPTKNTAYRMPVAFRKADGTLITSWTGADTEVSLDGAAFADATSEATEIGTSGCGYVDLTAAELNADMVWVKITVTNTDALPLVVAVTPQRATAPVMADVEQIAGVVNASATLNLTKLNIVNSAGDAIVATSTGGNGAGMRLTGNGAGQGLVSQGGAIASGALVQGGATSGNGLDVWAQTDGKGIYAYGIGAGGIGIYTEGDGGTGITAAALQGNQPGVNCVGFGSQPGIQALGGATGSGIAAQGGATSGHGITAGAVAGNGAGMALTGHGTNAGLLATGGATGPGISGDGNGGAADINGVLSTDAISAAALSAAATAEIADGVWDELLAGHVTAGSAGLALADAADEDTPAAIAEAVWALTDGIETGYSPRATLRIVSAAVAGVNGGNETLTPAYRNLPNTKVRVDATLDAYANRTTATYDGS